MVRRLKGALSIGALWGTAGSIVGALGGLVANLLVGAPILAAVLDWGLGAGAAAFLLGTGFAGLLTLLERRRTLDELTTARAAALGALVGAVIPPAGIVLSALVGFDATLPLQQLIPVLMGASASYATLTAALAAGTISLAKHGPDALSGVAPEQPSLAPPDRDRRHDAHMPEGTLEQTGHAPSMSPKGGG